MCKKTLDLLKTVAEYMTKSNGFDQCMKGLTIVSAGQGKCVVEFKVSENQLNRGGSLHGGFIAAVIDNVTTYALMANNSPPGVSVDLNVSYLRGTKAGEDVIVTARTVRAGKKLAFLECELLLKKDNSILAKGGQTKYIG